MLNRGGQHRETWEAYLGLTLRDEIVGQRYLRTVLLRMKFELAMVPALAGGVAGLLWLNAVQHFWPFHEAWLWGGGVALIAYFAWESFDSARLMGATRLIVVRAVRRGQKPTFD